jgi:ABC-type lipoprotein export system ATPase subunit
MYSRLFLLTMLKEIISLQNISRFYNNRKIKALSDITLSISQGEFVSITGPSGSGKSTLLNIMSGLDKPTGGEVLFNNQKVDNNKTWIDIRSKKIGFVFQKFNLLPTFTALENVELPMFGVVNNSRQRRAKATELLNQMGLKDRLYHFQSELSGGEQQRVAIARSLANSPDIIFADEPTGNLDSKTSESIISLLMDIHLKYNRTLVIVTHDEEIARISNRVISILDGEIVNESF